MDEVFVWGIWGYVGMCVMLCGMHGCMVCVYVCQVYGSVYGISVVGAHVCTHAICPHLPILQIEEEAE